MGQLDLLWEYQELDQIMGRCVNKKKKLPIRRDYMKLKRYLVRQQDKLIKLDEEADKKSNTLNKIHHEYENILSSFNNDQQKLKSGEIKSLKQLEQIERNVPIIKEKIDKKEEELHVLLNELDVLSKQLESIRLYVAKATKSYTQVKAEYDKQMKVIEQEYLEAKKKRNEIRKGINKGLLDKYKNIKENYDTPVAMVNSNCCGGCNMQLASLVIQNVREKEQVVECENCGRILYVKGNTKVS